ncbi:uncharacterized protein LOC34618775 [Cyclospora cayetanensis]|uniref:Uncharacterized protein LOC34618775 n=1 Tax=Cyclospora cayetanensis TaxID=88456 RepID=A0A6P6S083_9EIME|nr:uncharacterized protein LOC34618775 [Cyclospora cayetanensis]
MASYDSEAEQPPEIVQQYKAAIEAAKRADNSEFERIGLARDLGKDIDGRAVLLFVPCMISTPGVSLEKALNYCLLRLTETGESPFVLIFAESLASWIGGGTLQFISDCFSLIPNPCKKNLQQIFIVHPTAGSQGLFSVISSIYSGSFPKKVVWVERLIDVLKTLQMPVSAALKLFPYPVQVEEERRVSPNSVLTIFGTPLGVLAARTGVRVSSSLACVPYILTEFRHYLLKAPNVTTKDLLLLQGECQSLYAFVGDIDYGDPRADWTDTPVVASCFRLLLEGLERPLFGSGAFENMASAGTAGGGKDRLVTEMKTSNFDLWFVNAVHFALPKRNSKSCHTKPGGNMLSAEAPGLEPRSFDCYPITGVPEANLGHSWRRERHIWSSGNAWVCIEALTLAITNPNLVHEGYSLVDSGESSSEESSSEEESEESSSSDDAPAKQNVPTKPQLVKAVAPKVTASPAASAAKKTAPLKKRKSSSSSSEAESKDSEDSDDDDEEEEEEEEEDTPDGDIADNLKSDDALPLMLLLSSELCGRTSSLDFHAVERSLPTMHLRLLREIVSAVLELQANEKRQKLGIAGSNPAQAGCFAGRGMHQGHGKPSSRCSPHGWPSQSTPATRALLAAELLSGSMDPYSTSTGAPLGLGGRGHQSTLSTPTNHSGGASMGPPLSYGVPNYPSGGPPGGLMGNGGLSATENPLHGSIGMKSFQAGVSDVSGVGGSPSGGPLYTSSTKYIPGTRGSPKCPFPESASDNWGKHNTEACQSCSYGLPLYELLVGPRCAPGYRGVRTPQSVKQGLLHKSSAAGTFPPSLFVFASRFPAWQNLSSFLAAYSCCCSLLVA